VDHSIEPLRQSCKEVVAGAFYSGKIDDSDCSLQPVLSLSLSQFVVITQPQQEVGNSRIVE
jgi:hypothetical protein